MRAMAGSDCNGTRKSCVGFGVSRVGPSTPRPPSSETSIQGYHLVPDASTSWNAATIVVVLTTLAALVGMVVAVIILRRRRIREQQQVSNVAGHVAKAGQDDEDVNKEGKWSAGAVELVVMAGETQPTCLAHPVPAPCHPPIQCPPLTLP